MCVRGVGGGSAFPNSFFNMCPSLISLRISLLFRDSNLSFYEGIIILALG